MLRCPLPSTDNRVLHATNELSARGYIAHVRGWKASSVHRLTSVGALLGARGRRRRLTTSSWPITARHPKTSGSTPLTLAIATPAMPPTSRVARAEVREDADRARDETGMPTAADDRAGARAKRAGGERRLRVTTARQGDDRRRTSRAAAPAEASHYGRGAAGGKSERSDDAPRQRAMESLRARSTSASSASAIAKPRGHRMCAPPFASWLQRARYLAEAPPSAEAAPQASARSGRGPRPLVARSARASASLRGASPTLRAAFDYRSR